MPIKTRYTKYRNGTESNQWNSPDFESRDQHLSNGIGLKEVTYSWKNVDVYYRGRDLTKRTLLNPWKRQLQPEKHILKNVNGICQSGELLAIMGASGAGKTTLMNVLTHRNMSRLTVQGSFSVNGKPMNPRLLTKYSAYVQQEDLFIETLTVHEQLVFQAMLRMDKYVTYKQRLDRVEELILELGLTKCAFNLIGDGNGNNSISGGERRRLNFGCEILTNPCLLFCDEPTSGLDSFMAQNVVAVMKNMAEKGKTILSTIHQPSSEVYAMFDRVLLMAQGQVAFLGDADAAFEFFSKLSYRCPVNYNPADHYLELLSVVPKHEQECFTRIKVIVTSYTSTEEPDILQAMEENENYNGQADPFRLDENEHSYESTYKNCWLSQIKILVWRSWMEMIRNTALIKIRPIQLVVLALMLGLLFQAQTKDEIGAWNINGLIFMLLLNMTFQNAGTVVDTFCGNRGLLLREHHSGLYRIDVYFLAKIIVDFPLFLFYAILYTSIIYYMVGLNPSFLAFLFGVGTMAMVAQTVISYGYMVSCAAKSTNMALALLLPPIIPLMLNGGFFLNRRSIPPILSWIQWLSWFNFGNEALMINQWKDVKNLTCSGRRRCFADGDAILTYYDYNNTDPYFDLSMLFFLCILYRLLAFMFLWLNIRKKNNKNISYFY